MALIMGPVDIVASMQKQISTGNSIAPLIMTRLMNDSLKSEKVSLSDCQCLLFGIDAKR